MRNEMSSRDSISSCDNYYTDFYSVVRNPNAAPVKKPLPIEDVIESQQELIEKEITEKIQGNELEVESQTLALLAKAGKYLFLGVVLPPYLLLYKVPKWVAADAIPGMLNKISEGVESLKNALTYPFRIFSNPVPKPQQVEKVEDQKGFDLVAMARNGVYSLGSKFFHPFYQATMWLTNGITSLGAGMMNLAAQISQGIGFYAGQAKNTFLEAIDKARQGIKYAGQAFHSLVQPSLHWFVGKVDAFMRVTKRVGEWTFSLLKGVAQETWRAFRHPIQVSREAIGYAAHQAKTFGSFVARRAKKWAEPKMQFIQTLLNPLQQAVRKVSRKIQEKTDKAKQKMQEVAANFLQQAQQIISSVWFVPYVLQQMTPEWLVRWARPKLAFMNRMAKYTAKAGRFAANQLERLGKKFMKPVLSFAVRSKQFMAKVQERAARAFRSIKERTKAIPKKIAGAYMYVMNQLKTQAKRGFYLLRVILAWIRVCGRLWMQLVKELAEEIGHWVSY